MSGPDNPVDPPNSSDGQASPDRPARRTDTVGIGIAPTRSEDMRSIMPAAIRKHAYVTVISGSKKYAELSLDGDVSTIGRGPGVDLVLEEPSASRHHVSITKTPDGHILRDLGSTNGTYLKGVLKGEERLLEDDACFRIGATELVYHAGRSKD